MLSIAARRVDRDFDRQAPVFRRAIVASACGHLIAVFAAAALAPLGKAAIRVPQEPVARERAATVSMIFFPSAVIGGGGGGGNRQAGPIRRAESAGRDRMTIRVRQPVATSGQTVSSQQLLPSLVLDAVPLANGMLEQLGLPDRGANVGTSTGPGSGGGVGEGVGTGIGSGRGPGIGAGSGGGFGGGVYRPGGAVSAPEVLSQVRPTYTADALDRRIQGSVELQLIVTAAGVPSDVRVIRSLDPAGLDVEAVNAVRRWTFKPGRLAGAPVDVLVRVVLDFTIH